MTHEEIERREFVELYVRNRLSEAERHAFEDHFFACQECFDQVQLMQKFVDGIQHAGSSGQLAPSQVVQMPSRFSAPFWIACAASVALAVLSAWGLLIERPRLLAQAEQARLAAQAAASELASTKLALNRPTAQSNLPLLMLEASRAATPATITPSASATQLALWLEPPPTPKSSTYRLDIRDSSNQLIETLPGLTPNSYGALAAAVPLAHLPAGLYTVHLYATADVTAPLLGEYKFQMRK